MSGLPSACPEIEKRVVAFPYHRSDLMGLLSRQGQPKRKIYRAAVPECCARIGGICEVGKAGVRADHAILAGRHDPSRTQAADELVCVVRQQDVVKRRLRTGDGKE